MNGFIPVDGFPSVRSRHRRFRLCPQSLRIASPSLTAQSPVHLPGEWPVPCGTDSLPGSRGLPMSIHRCAWQAQDTRVSGTSSVGFGAHFRRLSPPATFPSEPPTIADEFPAMKHRGPFSGLTLRLKPLAALQNPNQSCD